MAEIKEAWLNNNVLSYQKLKKLLYGTDVSLIDTISEIKANNRKKIITFYGNCQTLWEVMLSASSKSLTSDYFFLWLDMVHLLNEERHTGFDVNLLKLIDIFIYQHVDISEKNPIFLSTDYILNGIREDVPRICIPNVYFNGYFPQYCRNIYNRQMPDLPGGENGLFPYGDINIQNLMDDFSKDYIAQKLSDLDFYTKSQCENNVLDSINELKLREEKCDVIISDYILENYKYIRLFYTNNHPFNFVLKELLIRAYKTIDIDVKDIDVGCIRENDGREQFVYPSVVKNLNLTWAVDKKVFFYNKSVKNEPSDMYDYVSAYIDFCKETKSINEASSHKKHRLFIWGRGRDSKALMDSNPFLLAIADAFIDSNKSSDFDHLYKKPIFFIEEVNITRNDYVIIATRKYYDEISGHLNTKGLRYIEDYSDYLYAWEKWKSSSKNQVLNQRIIDFLECQKKLEKWIPDVHVKLDIELFRQYVLEGNITPERTIVGCCVDRNAKIIDLKNARIEYDSEEELSVQIHELLLNEDYYFVTNSDAPYIIDGGANIGLAIYYFKELYPKSTIISFEPNAGIYEILDRNSKRNGWENVELYQCALDSEEGEKVFHIQEYGMAGSLESRNIEDYNGRIADLIVKTTILNKYISNHVDYLKLDIEGSETKVIETLGDLIQNIDHFFIEFHEGSLKGNNSISKILTALEDNGFCVNVGKSHSYTYSTMNRPMRFVGKRISEVIWAKRIQ